MQDKCDTLVCVSLVCLSHCLCVCLFSCASVFVYLFALAFISKSVCVQICHTNRPCVGLCVCVCVYTWWACGTCWRKMARSRTMCHNYAQGVTVKTALKPNEVVFTNINIQIEHHIGVSCPPPIPCGHAASLSYHFLCVFMGVCQYGKCMQFLPHLFPFRYDRGEKEGEQMTKSLAIDQGLERY